MSFRPGICKNYTNCDSADKETIFTADDGVEFICPDCKKPLQDIDSSNSSQKEFKAPGKRKPWIGWTMIAGLAVLAAWGIWAFNAWMQGEPRIQLSAASLTFGFQQVGVGEGSQEVEIKNIGKSGTLDISEIRSSDPGFTVRKKTYALEPGKTARLEILFAPTTPGSHAATLTVVSDDPTQQEAMIKVAGTSGNYGANWLWERLDKSSKILKPAK